MKRLLIIFLCSTVIASPARGLTMDECVGMARENYPLIKRYELIERTARIDLSDIGKSWLPQIGVYAQGTVQSDTPGFPDKMLPMLAELGLDIPGMRKDQYKVGLDVSQTIWDGGKSKADKEVARADARVQMAANEVELYAVEERVQDLFFAILLVEAQVRQAELTAGLLQGNLARLRSMFANGTAMQSDVDAVEAEYLAVAQNITRLKGNAESFRRVLELFIASPLAGKTLECPQAEIPGNLQPDRPELRRFDAELAKVESMRRQAAVSTAPKIGLFAQAYYGYPGYDYFQSMMTHDWGFNVMGGIRVSWAIDAFYTKKNRLSRLSLAGKDIENSREVFLFNTNLASAQGQAEIRKQQAVLADDERIVELRTSVRKAAESRLANGVIDTTDLLSKITDEAAAAVNAAYHKIELAKTVYQLKHTLNR